MKKRIQRNLCIFVATMLLLSLVSVSAAAAETSINPIPDKTPGSNVTITGTSVYDRVSIKVIKPDGTIYDVDSVQTMGGNYNYNFTLPEEITGVYTVVVGKANSVASITFNVVAETINRAPVLDPIGNKTITVGEQLKFTVSATDPDDDELTYSAEDLPAGATFNFATGEFSWTPDEFQLGSYTMRFIVSDGELMDYEDVVITVIKSPDHEDDDEDEHDGGEEQEDEYDEDDEDEHDGGEEQGDEYEEDENAAIDEDEEQKIFIEKTKAFVERLYELLLNRKAESEGLNFWVDKLLSREYTAAEVVEYIVVYSPEFANKNYTDEEFVEMCYLSFFNRRPDESGKNFWLSKLEEGYSRRWVIANMLNAPTQEFKKLCDAAGIEMGMINTNRNDLPKELR